MRIRTMEPADLPEAVRIWNRCAKAGEVLYSPLDEDGFCRTFLDSPGCGWGDLLAAEEEGGLAGFLQGVGPASFPEAREGSAYLTVVMTDPARRGQGAGSALLDAFGKRMAGRGAKRLEISGLDPVRLEWRLPGTPGHNHDHMPGADMGCAGYPFLLRRGFSARYREIALYRTLSAWQTAPEVSAVRDRLSREGIRTGAYDAAWECGFDRMCSAVGSRYWRDVLRTEIAAWKTGRPNSDPRMWADNRPPRGPRPLITAVHNGQIVGFTGPVDLQKSGRGWFTGICTDPAYGRRGIATVLFSLLMEAFVREGAKFTTLYTGEDNPARKIYEKAGLRPVRRFSLMIGPLRETSSGAE